MSSKPQRQVLDLQQQVYSLQWQVNHWRNEAIEGRRYESGEFSLVTPVEGQPQLSWVMHLRPMCENGGKKVLELSLLLLPLPSHCAEDTIVNFADRIRLFTFSGQEEPKAVASFGDLNNLHPFPANPGNDCTLHMFVSHQNLLQSLVVEATVWCRSFRPQQPPQPQPQPPAAADCACLQLSDTDCLRDDLERLFDSSDFADFVVVCGDGSELRLHRALLRGRSRVLDAMLRHDTAESSGGRLLLDDCRSHAAAAAFFRFLYCGSLRLRLQDPDQLRVDIADLTDLATKYDVSSLLQQLEESLVRQLHSLRPHLVFLLALAAKYQLARLRAACLAMAEARVFPAGQEETREFRQLLKDYGELGLELLHLNSG